MMFQTTVCLLVSVGITLANHGGSGVSSEEIEGQGGSPGGHMGGAMMHEFPQWLQSAASIFTNPNLTRIEKTTLMNSWAAQQNATIQALYQQFVANCTARQANITAAYQAAIAKLSSAAIAAYGQIQTIANNESLTCSQTYQGISDLFHSFDNSTVQELRSAGPPPMVSGCFGGPGGHMGGPRGWKPSPPANNAFVIPKGRWSTQQP